MAIVRLPIDLSWAGAGSPGVNVWHVDLPDALSQANLQSAVDIIRGFYDAVRAIMPTGTVIRGQGLAVDVVDGSEQTYTPFSLAGAAGTGYAPPATAVCVNWRTGTALRSGVGRTFLSPIGTAVVQADGTIAEANLAVIRNAATALCTANLTTFDGPTLGIVVYSRQNGSRRQIGSARVRDQFAVLRSRRD